MLLRALGLLAVLLSLPSAALAADEVGPKAFVKKIEVNTTSAETYLQYHGRIVLKGEVVTEYRWGGTSCGTRVLTDAQVELLMQAASVGMRVVPRYQLGQGDILCLVGFGITS